MLDHKHIIIRAEVNKPPTDIRKIKKQIKKLIKSLGMKPLGRAVSVYVSKEGNKGLTCVQPIETSHIALHSWDECEPALLQLDVYTCSKLDKKTVFNWFEIFEPKDINYLTIDRKDYIKIEK